MGVGGGGDSPVGESGEGGIFYNLRWFIHVQISELARRVES